MKTPKLTVTIDRLVLNGFPPAQRAAVVANLQTELQRLLAAQHQNGFTSRNQAFAKAAPVLHSESPTVVGAASGQQLFKAIVG